MACFAMSMDVQTAIADTMPANADGSLNEYATNAAARLVPMSLAAQQMSMTTKPKAQRRQNRSRLVKLLRRLRFLFA